MTLPPSPSTPPSAARVLLAPDALDKTLPELFGALMGALRVDGIPVDRASCAVPTMHPELRSVQIVWYAETGVKILPRTYTDASSAMFARSPLRPLYLGEQSIIRAPLAPDDGPHAYEILDELSAAGFTDYLATITTATNPWERAPVTWATRAPGGFSDAHQEALLGLLPLLALVIALHAQRASTRALLTTYLGSDAASRVLDGHIRRGDVVDLQAAVCFCDLRSFTDLSQRLSQPELLALLDDAFEAVVGAVEVEGGDILKFIGDAVLAVFRVEDGADPTDAVRRAARAGEQALRNAQAKCVERVAQDRPPLVLGLSLHLGRVAYGNIGGPRRLDFTVIGAAVNLASRLEGMCRTLGFPMVMSDEAARHLDRDDLVDAGLHALKGIPAPVRIWGARVLPGA